MKKLGLMLLLATAGTTALQLAADCCSTTKKCQSCECEATSKTFFSVRPMYGSVKPELIAGFRNERAHVRENGKGGAIEAVLFGSKSTNDKRLASYFMPDCKTCLTAGDSVTEQPDLDCRHFGIFPNQDVDDQFKSNLSFSMNQSVMGLGLHYKQLFCWNPEETKGWWMSVSSPLMRVKNTVNMKETIIDPVVLDPDSGSTITSMTQAFNQSGWKYGKIACDCPKAKKGLGDIEVKLGYEMLPCPKAHFACYGGLIIPTGNKAKAEYVFEPIVGNGKHVGLMTGMEGGYIAWENVDKNHWLSFECATNTQYLFKNTQMRSFDVKNKPWSRYQALYANAAQAAETLPTPGAPESGDIYLQTPGINILTSKVEVTPRLAHNITTAAIYNASAFRIEVGYNLFCRQAECVKLDCPWATGDDAPVFKKQFIAGEDKIINALRPIGFVETGANRTIGFAFDADTYADLVIQESDLDMQSATHPAIVTNTFHLALGYRWDEIKFPVHIDAGASYEFAQDNNTVLDRWAVWGKAGFAF